MDHTLYYMPFSPWSHKARFALRHHQLALREHAYVALIEEPVLRLRLRKWRGRVTVPVLFTPHGALTDSWDIVQYADRNGSGSALVPADKSAAIADWNAASERLLSASRSSAMLRTLETPEVLLEVVPKPAATLLGRPGAALSARLFNAKYGIRASELPHYEQIIREELSRVQRALADGRAYLLDHLTYADVAMGIALMLLGPLPGESVIGLRQLWSDARLTAEYPDLLAWRDALHARHPLLAPS